MDVLALQKISLTSSHKAGARLLERIPRAMGIACQEVFVFLDRSWNDPKCESDQIIRLNT